MWPQRVKDAAKNAISMGIFWGVVLILYVLYVGPYITAAKTRFYLELSGKKDIKIELDYDPNDY